MGKSVDVQRLQRLVDDGTWAFVWMRQDTTGKVINQLRISPDELLRLKNDITSVRAYAPNVMMVFTR
jgi:hypothetical protein